MSASNSNLALALAAVLVGGAILARRAGAAPVGDDVLQEIQTTARRLTPADIAALFDNLKPQPLGIRNNNPMNVRETSIQWQGELPHDGDGYEDFGNASDGIRAGARVLLNYYRQHGLRTIAKIIARWAPPEDNNPTAKYVQFVAERVGLGADVPLNMESVETLTALSEAIIAFENGVQPYTRAFIADAVRRAF